MSVGKSFLQEHWWASIHWLVFEPYLKQNTGSWQKSTFGLHFWQFRSQSWIVCNTRYGSWNGTQKKKKKKKKKRVRSTKGWQNKNRSFTQEQIIWPLHRSLTGRWDQGSKFNRELKNKLPIRVPQWKPLTKYYKVQLDISPSSFLPPQKTYFYCQVLRINLLGHIFHHVMLWPGSKQVLGWTWNTSSSFPCFPRNRIPFFSWTAHSQVDNI